MKPKLYAQAERDKVQNDASQDKAGDYVHQLAISRRAVLATAIGHARAIQEDLHGAAATGSDGPPELHRNRRRRFGRILKPRAEDARNVEPKAHQRSELQR